MSATRSTSFEWSSSPSGRDLIPVHYYSSRLEKTQGQGCSDIEDRAWRADLRVLVLKDLAKGAFGTRQHQVDGPILSYTLTYQIDMTDEALHRFARDPTGILDDPETPTLFEVFECTKVWISYPQTNNVEVESSRAIIQQGKTEIKCNDNCIKRVTLLQSSALPNLHTSSTLRTFNSPREAMPYPNTYESYGTAQHHPRVSGEDASLLRPTLGVFHRAYKQPNAPIMRRVRAHPTRPMRERPVREGEIISGNCRACMHISGVPFSLFFEGRITSNLR